MSEPVKKKRGRPPGPNSKKYTVVYWTKDTVYVNYFRCSRTKMDEYIGALVVALDLGHQWTLLDDHVRVVGCSVEMPVITGSAADKEKFDAIVKQGEAANKDTAEELLF